MKSFVTEFVERWVAQESSDWAKWTIVVPNKLVGFYVQKELRSRALQATWSPIICTLPELATQLSGFSICSASDSMHHLVAAYRKVMADNGKEMMQFVKWGNKLHNDFADVAMSLADANQIYRDLRSIKEVEHWEIGADHLSGSQQRFMQFWNGLEEIYGQWKQSQEEAKSMVYPLLLRWLLSNSRQWEGNLKGRSIALVGIAGLTRAEDMVLQMIKSNAHVEINWDADKYYVGPEWHEAGWPIRKHAAWINPAHLTNHILHRKLSICHVHCESFHGQCAAIVEELMQRAPEEWAETAILLPDDTWISPLMSLLHGQGFFLSGGHTRELLHHSIVHWIPKIIRMETDRNGRGNTYYNRDLMEILDLSSGWLLASEDVVLLQKSLMAVSRGYWDRSKLEEIGWTRHKPEAWVKCFSSNNAEDKLTAIEWAIGTLDEMEYPWVIQLLEVIGRIKALAAQHPEMCEPQILAWFWQLELPGLLNQSIKNQDGQLQILLMTDSRALDFKHLIIPGCNEGSLPKKAEVDSFIPLDVRRLHRMHLPEDIEASYAYVFYRLLQRSTTVTLLSGAVDAQSKEQEVSRFILQLISELKPLNPNLEWEEKSFRLPIEVPAPPALLASTQWSREQVEILITKGLSASSINKFKECPLDFYFRYVVKMEESDDIDETITDAELGVLVHAVLEAFYGRFIGAYPNENDFKTEIEALDQSLEKALVDKKMILDTSVGYNALIHFAAKEMLSRYLSFEMNELKTITEERVVVAVERKFTILLDSNTGLKFNGYIDRMERWGNTLKILDYKTGKLEKGDYVYLPNKKTNQYEDIKSSKLIQLMIYQLAAEGMEKEVTSIEAGFISLRQLSNGWCMFESNGSQEEWRIRILGQLNDYLASMRAMETWTHREGARYCEHCEALGYHASAIDVELVGESEEEKSQMSSNETN